MKKSSFSIIKDILFYSFIIVILITSISILKGKQEGKAPTILGYRFYNILTGSMEPNIPTGSLVITKNVDLNDIKVGDVISFGEGTNATTHRVKEVHNNNGIQFTTKGDANNVNDPRPIDGSEVFGKVVFHIIGVGYLVGFIQNNLILSMFILIVFMLMFSLSKKYYIRNKNYDGSKESKSLN